MNENDFPIFDGQNDSLRDKILGQRFIAGPEGQLGKPNLVQRIAFKSLTVCGLLAGVAGAKTWAGRVLSYVDRRRYQITFGTIDG